LWVFFVLTIASPADNAFLEKQFPKLPKSRTEIHDGLGELNIKTNKDENCTLVNDTESGIVIFSCRLNLECLCNDMTDIVIDGTFKYCP
jgi:hypothetical protein